MIGCSRIGVPGWRAGWLAAALLSFTVAGLRAQSTRQLGGLERPMRFELSAGGEYLVGSGFRPEARMALFAVRWQGDHPVGYRVWASWIQLDGLYSREELLTVGVSADLTTRVGRSVPIALSVGTGFTRNEVSGLPNAKRLGLLGTAGLAVRFWHLVIEQHAVVNSTTVDASVLLPTTIGWRF